MKTIINSHNKKILSDNRETQDQPPIKECNCRKKPDCPLNEKCLQTNVIYQATVTTDPSTTETYVGLATNFKERYRNHLTSFRLNKRRNETELSKYIWTLKDVNKPFTIKWKILKKCNPYNNISKKCNLCLSEKFIIICRKKLCSLNKRNELASPCPHRSKHTLRNFYVT
jgi:hypothetical protein